MPEFLINLGNGSRYTLLLLFNLIWRINLSSEWMKTEMPIPKKGKEPNSLENFRPVSLISVMSKVYERMILSRLQAYFENNCLLSPNQAGFTKHRAKQSLENKLKMDFVGNKAP